MSIECETIWWDIVKNVVVIVRCDTIWCKQASELSSR